MMNIIRYLMHILVVRPIVRGLLGVNINRKIELPETGPAVVVANHNSHLDALLIMSLFPARYINKIRPVAAEDYFFKNPCLSWFVTRFLRVVPIRRHGIKASDGDPLSDCSKAINKNEILVIFPEGTRGNPGEFSDFKTGISHIAKRHPQLPFIPVYIDGLETVLPRGSWIPVPLVCNVYISTCIYWKGNKQIFMEKINRVMRYMEMKLSRRSKQRMLLLQSKKIKYGNQQNFA